MLTVEYCAGQGVGPDLPVGGALLQGPGLPGVALLQGAGVHLGREAGREGGAGGGTDLENVWRAQFQADAPEAVLLRLPQHHVMTQLSVAVTPY